MTRAGLGRRLAHLAAAAAFAWSAALTPVAWAEPPASPDPEAEQRAYWQERKAELERTYEEARLRFERAEAEYSRGRRANRAKGERRAELKRDLAEARKALAQAESELEAFPEEARRAGVPPGWIR